MTPDGRSSLAQVLAAAQERAAALASGDRERLAGLLHPDLRWTSHTGATFDRAAYLAANTREPGSGGPAPTAWSGQVLEEPEVVAVGPTAVLRCTVLDTVDRGRGAEAYRMPMTQVWVAYDARWLLLAGHAGPLLGPDGTGITAPRTASSQE